jgi:TonB family protein
MTLFCIGCSVLLLAQRPPVKAIDPPPEPPRLYWPGGLPPYHLMPPYEEPPMTDDRPLTVPDSIRSVVDVEPSFPGGEVALRAYLQENLGYPELALEIGSEGRVRVAFVVRPNGNLNDVHVPKGEPQPELHQAALRLVRNMPHWVPAHVNGSMVAAHASILVPFRIRY